MIDPPAMIAFTAGKGFFNRILGGAIRLVTGGDCNHVAIIQWSDEWEQWLAIGANARGLEPMSISEFEKERIIKHLFAPLGFSLMTGLRKHVNDLAEGYDYPGLLGMFFVEIGRKLGLNVRNFLSVKGKTFCSRWSTRVIDDSLTPERIAAWVLYNWNSNRVSPAKLCAVMIASPTLWREEPPDYVHSAVMSL